MRSEHLPQRTLVLLGAGHTHAHVMQMWGMQPIPETQLICVSPFGTATYSGMLPGVLSGQYAPEAMEIDLLRFCRSRGVRWISESVERVDVARRELIFEERPPLRFDALSIGIGSVPRTDNVEWKSERVIAIKPMPNFLTRLEAAIVALAGELTRRVSLRVAIVGGGAGGVEISLCLPETLRRIGSRAAGARDHERTQLCAMQMVLVQGGDELPAGFAPSTQRRVRRALSRAGVEIHTGFRVAQVRDCEGRVGLTSELGGTIPVDLVVWAAQAAPPPLLRQIDLPKDKEGFLLIDETLRTTAGAPVFVVGDTASFARRPLPKCGVYAVRQGPVLWKNLQRTLRGESLIPFQPQRDFLRLLNVGDGSAIGEWHRVSFEGFWVWRWKDRIDRRFMEMYRPEALRDRSPMHPMTKETSIAPTVPRCVGCGGKIGSDILSSVIGELAVPRREEVVLGLESPDDAAVLQFAAGQHVVATNDFFTAPVEDPYLAGRLSALHALSDAWAMGADPVAALATIVVPEGSVNAQYQVLRELMHGAMRELRDAQVSLVGGHTVEGPALASGFTILAQQRAGESLRKNGLQPGDRLVLTKPLGTGILLAALMDGTCHAAWWTACREVLLAANREPAAWARARGVRAMTDVTGFGIVGHLWEMTRGTKCALELAVDQLPMVCGADDVWRSGRRSTMDELNRAAFAAQCHDMEQRLPSEWPPILFDPQTCGGLVLAFPAAQVDEALRSLRTIPAARWAVEIAQVVPHEAVNAPVIRLQRSRIQ